MLGSCNLLCVFVCFPCAFLTESLLTLATDELSPEHAKISKRFTEHARPLQFTQVHTIAFNSHIKKIAFSYTKNLAELCWQHHAAEMVDTSRNASGSLVGKRFVGSSSHLPKVEAQGRAW